MGHDFVGTILTVGMYLVEMHLSQTHSAESSVVSRLYANSLIPVHCLELKYPTINVGNYERTVMVTLVERDEGRGREGGEGGKRTGLPVVPLLTTTLTEDRLVVILYLSATPTARVDFVAVSHCCHASLVGC